MDGDEGQEAQLEVDVGEAFTMLVTQTRGQAHADDGGPGGDHRGVLEAKLAHADPKHPEEIEEREGERGYESVRAPHRSTERERRMHQGRHR